MASSSNKIIIFECSDIKNDIGLMVNQNNNINDNNNNNDFQLHLYYGYNGHCSSNEY